MTPPPWACSSLDRKHGSTTLGTRLGCAAPARTTSRSPTCSFPSTARWSSDRWPDRHRDSTDRSTACCPFPGILGEATVSVGIAAAALDEFIELARWKVPAYQTAPMRSQQLVQFAVGKAKGRVDSARDTLHRAAQQASAAALSGPLTMDAKIRVQLAACCAAEFCAEAVRIVHDAAGSSAIRLDHHFERHFRDIHVLTQHTSKSSPRYASTGRLLLGLDDDWGGWCDLGDDASPES